MIRYCRKGKERIGYDRIELDWKGYCRIGKDRMGSDRIG